MDNQMEKPLPEEPKNEVIEVNLPTSKLDKLAFAVASGLLFGITVLGITLTSLFWSWGKPQVVLQVGQFYLAYQPSLNLSMVATALAAINGFVGGFVFALLYNLLLKFLVTLLGEEDT